MSGRGRGGGRGKEEHPQQRRSTWPPSGSFPKRCPAFDGLDDGDRGGHGDAPLRRRDAAKPVALGHHAAEAEHRDLRSTRGPRARTCRACRMRDPTASKLGK